MEVRGVIKLKEKEREESEGFYEKEKRCGVVFICGDAS